MKTGVLTNGECPRTGMNTGDKFEPLPREWRKRGQPKSVQLDF